MKKKTPIPAMDRFLSKVSFKDENNGCWNWVGYVGNTGYGQFSYRGVLIQAHWFLLEKKPRSGQVACHKCDNPLCVRPSHIFVGSYADNSRDMCLKGRHNREASVRGCRKMLAVRVTARGSRAGMAKLKEDQVAVIKCIKNTFGMGTKLARYFGIGNSVISGIFRNQIWKHVTPTESDKQRAAAIIAQIGAGRLLEQGATP